MAKGRRVPPANELPPESDREREARHMQWIRENSTRMVDAARIGYQTEGRGAFVATPEQVTDQGVKVAYISDRSTQESGIGWPDETAARMVQTYDPGRQFVVIIVEKDGRASAYKVRFVDHLDTTASA